MLGKNGVREWFLRKAWEKLTGTRGPAKRADTLLRMYPAGSAVHDSFVCSWSSPGETQSRGSVGSWAYK
eukprot:6205103-Pleurochrysis_carterae.AAC.3